MTQGSRSKAISWNGGSATDDLYPNWMNDVSELKNAWPCAGCFCLIWNPRPRYGEVQEPMLRKLSTSLGNRSHSIDAIPNRQDLQGGQFLHQLMPPQNHDQAL